MWQWPRTARALFARAAYVEAGVRVYLLVYSDELRPAEITARVGLEPTEAHERGERIPGWRNTYKCHTWWLEPQAGVPGGVEEKLRVLLETVEPAVARIATLRPACDVEVSIVFKGWRGNPQFGGFHFEADVTRRIAALGAGLGSDLYAFGAAMPDDVPRSRLTSRASGPSSSRVRRSPPPAPAARRRARSRTQSQ